LSDKIELLDEIEDILTPKNDLDLKYLLITFLIISFIIALSFFKIYLHQQIYYESRKIAKLRYERDLLKEENKVIKSSVEAIRFKNQIADTMFDDGE
jgi:cell division protein FtsL